MKGAQGAYTLRAALPRRLGLVQAHPLRPKMSFHNSWFRLAENKFSWETEPQFSFVHALPTRQLAARSGVAVPFRIRDSRALLLVVNPPEGLAKLSKRGLAKQKAPRPGPPRRLFWAALYNCCQRHSFGLE